MAPDVLLWFLGVIFFIVFWVIPILKIAERTGLSKWWVVLCCSPAFNVGLWVLAYRPWPAVDNRPRIQTEALPG
jgi:hypothetical protein